MTEYNQPAAGIIRRRFSCRSYIPKPIEPELKERLSNFLAGSPAGPLGTGVRFKLVSAREDNATALKGLGTYGFTKGARGFIVGAVEKLENHNMEDYGYLLERAVLFATDIGLGTCWLGGHFQQERFRPENFPERKRNIAGRGGHGIRRRQTPLVRFVHSQESRIGQPAPLDQTFLRQNIFHCFADRGYRRIHHTAGDGTPGTIRVEQTTVENRKRQ